MSAESLDAQQCERAAAAELEAALRVRDPGAIKKWLVLLPIPFEGGDVRAVQAEQVEQESRLRPRAGERIKVGQREFVWRPVRLADYLIDFNGLAGAVSQSSVAYAVCYIQSETVQNGVLVKVGSDDQAKVYLNGELIYQCLSPREYVSDQDEVAGVQLNAGINALVFKVVNRSSDWLGSVRFTDAVGKPVKGIKVTLDPEAKDSP